MQFKGLEAFAEKNNGSTCIHVGPCSASVTTFARYVLPAKEEVAVDISGTDADGFHRRSKLAAGNVPDNAPIEHVP